MKKEQNYQLSKALVDSIKNLTKKSISYASIFSIAAISTVSFNTEAEAAAYNVTNGLTVTATDANGDTTTGDNITTADLISITTGTAIIGTTGTAMEFHDLIGAANADSAVALTGTGGLTLNGDYNANAKNLVTTVAADSFLTLEGNMLQGATEVASIILAGSTMTLSGNTAQTINGIILSDSGNDGILAVTGTGKKTVAGIIGGAGTDEIGSVTVAANSEIEFNGTLDTVAITNLGTLQIDAASNANTISNSGTLNINSTLDNIAGNGLTAITMAADGAINMNAAAAVVHDVSLVMTTDAHGTLTVLDASGGAAAAQQTINGDIGLDAKRLKQLTVGVSTANGKLLMTDGDVIFADDASIIGGDHADEDSIITMADSLHVTNGIVLTAASLGDATLAFNDNTAAVNSTINAGSGVNGAGSTTVAVSGASKTTVFNSDIGNTTGLDLVSVDTASAVFKKNVTATTLSIAHANGDATFSGTTAQTVTGNITATNGEGTLAVSNTTKAFTVTGTVGATGARLLEVAIADGTNAIFGDAISTLTLDIDSNVAAEFVQVSEGNIIGTSGATTGALQIVAGATLRLDTDVIAGTTVFDLKTATGNATGALIAGNFNIQPSSTFTSGTVFFIDAINANTLDSATAITNGAELANMIVADNAITDYTMVHGATTGADANITATAKSDTTIAGELVTTVNAARALAQANTAVGTDATLKTAFNNTLNSTFGSFDASEDTKLALQVGVQTDTMTGSATATKAMTGSVQGIVSNRMASLRSGDAYVTGMSAGNGMSAQSGFIQAFGSQVEQGNTKKGSADVYGYDAETSGVAIGFDGMTDAGSTIGLSASYSTTDVDGLGTGKSKNSIDSYTVSLYADKATDSGYIEGSLTYGLNDNSGSRKLAAGGLTRNYTSTYDSQQVSLKVSAGSPNEVSDGTFVTPYGSFTGTVTDTDAYVESSDTANDNLRLRVAQEDVTSLVGSVGVKAHKVTDKGTPMISFSVNNEFGDTEINSTNSYQGGGVAFNTSSDVEALSATLGLGYSFGSDMTSLNIGYEAEANDSEYVSHYGSIKIVSKF